MTRHYLKRASKTHATDSTDVQNIVQKMLAEIETGGEQTARDYAAKLDNYTLPPVLTAEQIAQASAKVSQKLKDDIHFAYENSRARLQSRI